MKTKRREPLLKRWRFLAQSGSKRFAVSSDDHFVAASDGTSGSGRMPEFDELVVGPSGEAVVHVESMSPSSLSVWLGHALFAVWRGRDGKIHVRLQEGEYEPGEGLIRPHGWRERMRGTR